MFFTRCAPCCVAEDQQPESYGKVSSTADEWKPFISVLAAEFAAGGLKEAVPPGPAPPAAVVVAEATEAARRAQEIAIRWSTERESWAAVSGKLEDHARGFCEVTPHPPKLRAASQPQQREQEGQPPQPREHSDFEEKDGDECPSGHPLELLRPAAGGLVCSGCLIGVPPGGAAWGCRPCNFTVCSHCDAQSQAANAEGAVQKAPAPMWPGWSPADSPGDRPAVTFSAVIKRSSDAMPFGVVFDPIDRRTLEVVSVGRGAHAGAVISYNLNSPPNLQIRPGCFIVSVNGKSGDVVQMQAEWSRSNVVECTVCFPREFTIVVDKSGGARLGIDLLNSACPKGTACVISDLKEGLITKWNAAHPTRQVEVLDRIAAVDGRRGPPADKLKALKAASGEVSLLIARPAIAIARPQHEVV